MAAKFVMKKEEEAIHPAGRGLEEKVADARWGKERSLQIWRRPCRYAKVWTGYQDFLFPSKIGSTMSVRDNNV